MHRLKRKNSMAITKKAKSPKPGARKPHARDWRDAIRLHLSKVPEVDAVFVSIGESTLHA
jgi:hypothetical protein